MSSTSQFNSQDGFNARLKKLRKSHTRMARGYNATVGRDGLIVFRPRPRRRGLPLRGIALTIAAFFAFKVLVLLNLGEPSYQARAAELAAGTAVEQAGAWLMQIDPFTRLIAQQIAPLI
ncbi:hypothetical protein [Roseovarius aquimarinus]|uniref:Uncharacterized protein n=1 Tax=Roseovarius aquimarinus TaxID=1229156 RepID=A0ABW7I618_9RHOB